MSAIEDAVDRLLPPPCDLGFGPKFARGWRHFQDEAAFDLADAPERFIMAVMATGSGKSLVYMAMAAVLNARTVVLTENKALMAQLQADFGDTGLVEVAGMGTYACKAVQPGGELYASFGEPGSAHVRKCHEGPCRVGATCSLKQGGCTYYDKVDAARRGQVINTNYDWWLHRGRARDLEGIDLLICDEAHEAPESVSKFLTVTLRPEALRKAGVRVPEGRPTWDEWRTWAAAHAQRLAAKVEELGVAMNLARDGGQTVSPSTWREAHAIKAVAGDLDLMKDVDAMWVASHHDKERSWTFTPAWPARYAERYLFRNVPKVLLTSATVRPKTAHYLGIPRSDLRVIEYPSVFPKAHRPVYHLPVAGVSGKPIRLRHDTRHEDLLLWIEMMDLILDARADRKGLIHCKSYDRAKFIKLHSRHAREMLTHSSQGLAETLRAFRASRPPCVLVSPSISTGVDFPGVDAEFQIIAKVPFLDSRDPVLQARKAMDADYDAYATVQELVQMAGRIVRSETDRGETFIVDDQVGWFLWKHRELAPDWFLDAVQRRVSIPPAPPKLLGERRRVDHRPTFV